MRRIFGTLILLLLLFPLAGAARSREEAVRGTDGERLVLPAIDLVAVQRADEQSIAAGGVAAFAVPLEVDVDPWRFGRWQKSDPATLRWSLPIASPGAKSLSLYFDRLVLPDGARLQLLAADGRRLARLGPEQVGAKGLWTAPFIGEEMVLDLQVEVARLDQLELHLARVHHGYAGFGEPAEEKIGSCHRDVVCGEGNGWRDDWREAAASVGLLVIDGIRFCTGFLVNNTAQDGRPLLITAGHCGINPRTAPSVVVMWGYRREQCPKGSPKGSPKTGGLAEPAEPGHLFQSGTRFLARHDATDIVLLELDKAPPAEAKVRWAGWDRGEEEVQRTAVIHHPATDVQRLALDVDRPRRTQYLEDTENPNGPYWRVSWELGSTEGGSSGAPLLDAEQRVIGVLRGGLAACGRREPDYFGRLGAAWDGRSPSQRLRDWLDPIASGLTRLDRFGR